MDSITARLDFALDYLGAPSFNKGRQNYLSDLSGCDLRTIRRWYAKNSIPSTTCNKIAIKLSINPNWLISNKGCFQALPPNLMAGHDEAYVPRLNISDLEKIKTWINNKTSLVFDESIEKITLKNTSAKTFVVVTETGDADPPFSVGSKLYIDPIKKPRHKDYVLLMKGDGIIPTVRQYLIETDRVLLESAAMNVPTTKLVENDEILGVVTLHAFPN